MPMARWARSAESYRSRKLSGRRNSRSYTAFCTAYRREEVLRKAVKFFTRVKARLPSTQARRAAPIWNTGWYSPRGMSLSYKSWAAVGSSSPMRTPTRAMAQVASQSRR